ncbi:MAG: hypothetical protein KGI25_09850 [Thaumarchaeota archaeon]|nr:hypothetical protein [Nitrososphaerota archaeon]
MVIPQVDFSRAPSPQTPEAMPRTQPPIGTTPQPNGESSCNDDCNGAVPAGSSSNQTP